uniref:non-specific serine/threonine protein kinase n=1 Tax=Haptolina brevifila TaxID=156173 RepID=A0A7S2DWG9_9EUKA|mmetsp:Transcript_44785/g.89446  ORF Transcript_44785/g.89446 Transcript_44785/m.89446 type:complete len:587 (+) Transcript_44785:85-1845(+)
MVVHPPREQRGPLGKVNGFQLLKFLGKGTFGAVYEARREADSRTYAIKKVDTRRMTTKERAEAVNEIRVLASVAGDHVISFYEAFVENDVLYIVTELASNGDLLQFLKNKRRAGHLPEATVWSFFIQMCLGVKTMHENNILHRDLKAANVFLCSNTFVKLGDLGVAKVLKHDNALASTQVGTPYYVAPEVWRNKAYNSKCDMWSLGCLLYELCTFRPPFEAESMEGLARKVMKGKYEQIPSFYSQALRTTLAKLLVVEPNYRSSVQEILSSDSVLSRMAEIASNVASQNEHPPQESVDLVGTIPVPRRFNDLTKNLPPSRYDTKLSPEVGRAANVAANVRNAADSKSPSEAGGDQVARFNRHSGGGNTVAKAIESAQQHRLPIKLPPGVPGQKDAQQMPPGYRQPPGFAMAPHGPGLQAAPSLARKPGQEGYPPHQRQRVPAESETGRVQSHQQGGGALPNALQHGQQLAQQQRLKLPQVPGAQPPPTPNYVQRGAVPRYAAPGTPQQPTREIRMVYHAPNGDSRVSIFARGNVSRNGGMYNPITHSQMAPGSRYHSRNQPGGDYPTSVVSQYTAQRRRVTPGHWY